VNVSFLPPKLAIVEDCIALQPPPALAWSLPIAATQPPVPAQLDTILQAVVSLAVAFFPESGVDASHEVSALGLLAAATDSALLAVLPPNK
jgi:hypothetical protein